MMIYVSGGSGSGKSAFAESLIVKSGIARRLYIATMEPFGAEAAARIERHRALRAGKGFDTVEQPTGLAGLAVPPGCAVLLEDLTNLFANEYFTCSRENAGQAVLDGLRRLCSAAALCVVVGNDIFSDGIAYDAETAAYLCALAALNNETAAMADEVYEVVCGIPIRQK